MKVIIIVTYKVTRIVTFGTITYSVVVTKKNYRMIIFVIVCSYIYFVDNAPILCSVIFIDFRFISVLLPAPDKSPNG